MYGTVALLKVKPGKANDFAALMRQMDTERQMKGHVGELVYKLDSDPTQYMLVVFFQDKASYQANANAPEQDKDYRRMRDMLEADPVWHDGEIVHEFRR